MDFNQVLNRVMRVVRFDASVYREIAADQSGLPGALVVIVAAVVLTAIGSAQAGVGIIVLTLVSTLLGFAVFTGAATLVSKGMFQGKTDFMEMGRTLGYTYVWQWVGILNLIPLLGGFIGLIAWVASLASGILALRESSEFDTTKAVITMVIATVLAFAVTFCVTGPFALMIGLGAAAAGQ